MVAGRAVNEGSVSRQLWLEGRPAIAEEIMVMRDAMLAEETGSRVHICHVSTARSVDIIRKMKKKKGVTLTCETCPQYFTLTEDEVLTQGAMARVNPPLRTRADIQGIVAGLRDGTIDVIATDHAPHSAEEKGRGLEKSAMGVVGLETAFAAVYTHLVKPGPILSMDRLMALLNGNAARRFGYGTPLAEGQPADLTAFDLEAKYTVDPADFQTMGRATPFEGRTVHAAVSMTLCGGTIVHKLESVVVARDAAEGIVWGYDRPEGGTL